MRGERVGGGHRRIKIDLVHWTIVIAIRETRRAPKPGARFPLSLRDFFRGDGEITGPRHHTLVVVGSNISQFFEVRRAV